ncbi:hypothetical protein YC2023_046307 [Brassica napus]
MAESLGINSQKHLQQVDVNGNTVLHIAVSMSCGAPWLGKMNNNSNVVIFIYLHEQVKCTQSTNKRHTYLAKPISRLSN